MIHFLKMIARIMAGRMSGSLVVTGFVPSGAMIFCMFTRAGMLANAVSSARCLLVSVGRIIF